MGAAKGMRLRGTSIAHGLQLHGKWVEWEGRAGAARGYLRSEYITGLWAFYQDHKSLLCKVVSGGGRDAFFGAPWCNCFFAITVTKNAALEASGTGWARGSEK